MAKRMKSRSKLPSGSRFSALVFLGSFVYAAIFGIIGFLVLLALGVLFSDARPATITPSGIWNIVTIVFTLLLFGGFGSAGNYCWELMKASGPAEAAKAVLLGVLVGETIVFFGLLWILPLARNRLGLEPTGFYTTAPMSLDRVLDVGIVGLFCSLGFMVVGAWMIRSLNE